MARNARIVSVSFPGVPSGENRQQAALQSALEYIDQAACEKPDLILLPETFTGLGCGTEAWFATAEPVPGPTTEALAAKARQYNCYIVAPMVHRIRKRIYNSAVLLDRRGGVVGSYHKMFPTIGEIETGITPGEKSPVFETDFGKVGFAICFDLNFEEVWTELRRRGAEMILFTSMYRGGRQLGIWAHECGCYVVTSTPGENSRIVNPLGQVLAESFVHGRIIAQTINMDYLVLHLDGNMAKFPAIKAKYGNRVEFEIHSPEAQFILTSHDPQISARDIVKEFKLETRTAYFARARRVRERALQGK